MAWWGYVLIAAVFFLILPGTIMMIIMPGIMKKYILSRFKPGVWSRDEWKRNKDPDIVEMNREGVAWRGANKERCRPVSIVSEGYSLAGEYYDFGNKKCAIFLGGRCDTLNYTAYYVSPYVKSGYNVLLVDWRAHGESDGKLFGAGLGELPDDLAWVKYAHDELGNEEIALHGICIGASSWCVLASGEEKEFPSYVSSLTIDGCFLSFYKMMISHMKKAHGFPWPCIWFLRADMKRYAHKDIKKDSPYRDAPNVKIPVLMIAGKEDQYVKPKDAETIYQRLGSSEKKLVWMPKGLHSHFRISNQEEYDSAIESFLLNLGQEKIVSH